MNSRFLRLSLVALGPVVAGELVDQRADAGLGRRGLRGLSLGNGFEDDHQRGKDDKDAEADARARHGDSPLRPGNGARATRESVAPCGGADNKKARGATHQVAPLVNPDRSAKV